MILFWTIRSFLLFYHISQIMSLKWTRLTCYKCRIIIDHLLNSDWMRVIKTVRVSSSKNPSDRNLFTLVCLNSVGERVGPVNGVFVSLDGVSGWVGWLGVLVWLVWGERTGGGGGGQVHGLQGARGCCGVVVVVRVPIKHPLQTVVGDIFVLKQRWKMCDLWPLQQICDREQRLFPASQTLILHPNINKKSF